MQETLHDHHTSISIGGRPICNQIFADDIELMGGSNGELQDLTSRFVDRATVYGMEVSTGKSKTLGFRNQVHEETSPYFLLGAQDQRLCAEQDQLPCGSTEPLLATVERGKLAWFGHVKRHETLSKTILKAPWKVGDAEVGGGNAR